jgi:hypothetical protein
LAEIPPQPPPATNVGEGGRLAGRQRRPSASAWSSNSNTAYRRHESNYAYYYLYRGNRPTLSRSFRPARPPEEGERGAGGSTPRRGQSRGGGGEDSLVCLVGDVSRDASS